MLLAAPLRLELLELHDVVDATVEESRCLGPALGLVLLTQPAISAVIGWVAYGERLQAIDWLGAAAIAAALVLVRLPQRGLQPGAAGAS